MARTSFLSLSHSFVLLYFRRWFTIGTNSRLCFFLILFFSCSTTHRARRRSDASRYAGRMSSAVVLPRHIELTIVFARFPFYAQYVNKKLARAYFLMNHIAFTGAVVNQYVGCVTHLIYVNCLSWKPQWKVNITDFCWKSFITVFYSRS